MKLLLPTVLVLCAAPALAQAAPAQTAPGPIVRPISQHDSTLSGQPIVLPQGPVRATYSEVVVPAGGRLAVHKHPYPRLALIMSGRLRVRMVDTGQVVEVKAGELAVDSVDQWHEAEVVGDEPVRMLIVDQAPPGVANTVAR